MVKYLLLLSCVVELVYGVLGDRLDPCPRHRGLADGLKQAENRINGRSLYRLDLRNAIRGYEPNKVYRLRVHTTSKKHKFNDASLVIDPFDSSCGFGRIIIDSDKLYSPKSCPDFVTTQQKEPMGRAHFKWEAPPCGCVHIRIRVHANSSYYIEDEYTQNGPLARTICPKAGAVISTPEPKPKIVVKVLSRAEKLDQLCELNKVQPVSLLMKGRNFMKNRELSFESEFEKERLEIALEQRQIETEKCCSEGSLMMECFGDVRRRRIDQFCGAGEPDVPFTRSRYDWIKQKQTECCWQIGEDRYDCFNYTIENERMINDGRNYDLQTVKDLDDFDPANDVDDFDSEDEDENDVDGVEKEKEDVKEIVDNKEEKHNPKYDKDDVIKPKKYQGNKKLKSKSRRKEVVIVKEQDDEDQEEENDEVNEDIKKDRKNGIKVRADDGDVDEDDNYDNELVDDEDNNDDDDRKGEKDRPTKVRNLDNKKLTPEECCFNGITAGTKVLREGMDGCFNMADKFQEIFTNWNRTCDRKFVVCCMRVVEGMARRSWLSRIVQ